MFLSDFDFVGYVSKQADSVEPFKSHNHIFLQFIFERITGFCHIY